MELVLKSWGHEQLVSVLHANHIRTIEVLHELLQYPDEAKEVIPSVGIRLSLKKKLKEHIEENSKIDFEFVDTVNGECPIDDPNVTLERINEEILIQQTEDHTLEIIEKGTEAVSTKIFNNIHQIDLESVLREDPLGPSIIKIYEVKGELCSTCQSYMCDIITTYILKTETRRLGNEDFSILAIKIVTLFPSECSKTYYVPPVLKKNSKINKSERARGKLVDKYRNKLTFIREADNLKNIKLTTLVEPTATDEISEALESKKWLLLHRDEVEVLHHWTVTYNIRQQDIKNNEYKTVAEIYENWPILQDASNYELIEKDFLMQHEVSFSNFTLKWNAIVKIVLELYKTKFSKEEEILYKSCNNSQPQDYETFIQIKLLCTVFAPKSNKITYTQQVANPQGSGKCVKSSKKSFWKPSKLEALEGIIVHVKVPGDLENVVARKRTYMSDKGLTLQPFIIFVGAELTTITKVYLRVDSVMYELSSILRALDVLFKVYLTFNLTYPPEVENLYYFVQWSVYEIHTESDTQVPIVCTILNKVQNRLNKKKSNCID